MKNRILLLFSTVSSLIACANDGTYAVSKIPVALLKDAHVVKRMEEIRFEISSLTKAKLYRKFAVTVLDENGDDYAFFYAMYDKFRSIESVSGVLFDGNGNKLKSLKKGDVEDRS